MAFCNICIDKILYGQPLLPKSKVRIPTLKDEIIRKIKRDIMDEFATKPVAKRLIISLKVCDSFPFIRVCKTIKYIMYSYHPFNRNAFLVLSRWLKGHRNMIHQVMVLHKPYCVYYCELVCVIRYDLHSLEHTSMRKQNASWEIASCWRLCLGDAFPC